MTNDVETDAPVPHADALEKGYRIMIHGPMWLKCVHRQKQPAPGTRRQRGIPKSTRARVCLILAVALVIPNAAQAQDDPNANLAAAIAKPVLPPGQTLAETQSFCESRVPPMPRVRNAGEWRDWARHARERTLRDVVFRGEAATWRDAPSKIEWLPSVYESPDYTIRALRFEAIPGLWIPALLYEPTHPPQNIPLILNVNGHDHAGKAAHTEQIRCANLARRGMRALHLEWFGMGQLSGPAFKHGLINAIDLTGTSGVAVHYLAMRNAVSHMLALPRADPARVAVTGLSGGGWQTIFFSALDERVSLACPVAGYSSFRTRARVSSDLGDSEQTPTDLATVVDYTHLTAMMAPRALLLTSNAHDNCCFAAAHALPPLVQAAQPIYELLGKPESLRTHVNESPGTHNYEIDNRQAFYRMLADFWSPPDTDRWPASEIAVPSDIRPPDDLFAPLPAENLTLHSLAKLLARQAKRKPTAPAESARRRLRAIVRPFDLEAQIEEANHDEFGGVRVSRLLLRQGQTWTFPCVSISRIGAAPTGTTLLLSDAGRAAATTAIIQKLDQGKRVVVIDPFDFGECAFADHAYLYALLVATIGERPLGLQVGQVIAAANRLSTDADAAQTVELMSIGPRSSVIATIAACLEPAAISRVELRDPLETLQSLIDDNRDFTSCPELFCFGLLADFEIADLRSLVSPRPVVVGK